MAAQPKKKISKVRSKTRRAHWRGSLPKLVVCAKCKTPKLPHRACPECGYYGRAKVMSTKLESRVAKSLDSKKPSTQKPAPKEVKSASATPTPEKKSAKPKETKKIIKTPKRSGEDIREDNS